MCAISDMLSRRLFSYVPLRRVSVSFGLSASEPPSSSGSPSSASTSTTTTTPAGNVRELPPVTNEAQLQMREEFFRKERQWESRVDLSKLTEDDKVIHEKHRVAAMSLHLSYEDPFTGLKVVSKTSHKMDSLVNPFVLIFAGDEPLAPLF